MSYYLLSKSQIFQFEITINATTDDGAALTGFKVYEGAVEGNNELTLKDDGKTTNRTFYFGETIPLLTVRKDTYTDGEYENYTVIDGNNIISVDMPIRKVSHIPV